jgi:arabinose-5-phosphate isomerase
MEKSMLQTTTFLEELLEKQKSQLDYFYQHLDSKEIEQVFSLVRNCSRTLFFTGVGKSGIVCKKIATTLTSTGTKALYVSPTDAIHGDLGIMESGDLVFLLSKSGESTELLNLIPYIRNKGGNPIAVVSNQDSRLSKSCECVVTLPLEGELCPHNLAPTTSSILQLLFGDLLAVLLMQEKKFTLEEYALNHPSGTIGKRVTLKVVDLMLKEDALPLCSPEELLEDVLDRFSQKACGCLLIVDQEKHLLGIFTDGDLRRALQQKKNLLTKTPMGALMSKEPTRISPTAMAYEALQLMESNQRRPITILPVTDKGGRVVGLIRLHDILQSGI